MNGDDEQPDGADDGSDYGPDDAEIVGDDDVQDAGGGMTMQLDAVVDSMEDVAMAPDLGPRMSGPPPLPPQRISKGMWVVGVLIVLAMAGLGIGAGAYVLGGGGETATAAPPTPAPSAARAGAESGPEAPSAEGEEEPSGVVQLDEFVFDENTEETPPPSE